MSSKDSAIGHRGVSIIVVIFGVVFVLVLLGTLWWYLTSARLPGPTLEQGIPGGVRELPVR
jgi:hypothetical protein